VTRYAYALDEATKTMLLKSNCPIQNSNFARVCMLRSKLESSAKRTLCWCPSKHWSPRRLALRFLFLSDNKAKKTRVQSGFNDGGNIEIVKGLAPDQQVILIGKQTLNDGQAVTVSEAK